MNIHIFVVEYDIFQWHKVEMMKPIGALKPLPFLAFVWTNIYKDLIVGLLNFRQQIIMVFFYFLFKYSHFCALQHPFKASTVAHFFMDNILKLNGMPKSIAVDDVSTFTRNLLQELF